MTTKRDREATRRIRSMGDVTLAAEAEGRRVLRAGTPGASETMRSVRAVGVAKTELRRRAADIARADEGWQFGTWLADERIPPPDGVPGQWKAGQKPMA